MCNLVIYTSHTKSHWSRFTVWFLITYKTGLQLISYSSIKLKHILWFLALDNIKLKSKTHSFCISCLDGITLQKVDHIKYLGLNFDSELSFIYHINHIVHKLNYSHSLLFRSRNCFPLPVRKKIALQLILPIMDYADSVYCIASNTSLTPLTRVYNRLCRFILNCAFTTHHCIMYELLDLPTPYIRRQIHWLHFVFKCVHFNYPFYLKQFLVPFSSTHHLRHTVQQFFSVPNVSKSISKKAFMFKAPSNWNNLPVNIHSISSFRMFKHGNTRSY